MVFSGFLDLKIMEDGDRIRGESVENATDDEFAHEAEFAVRIADHVHSGAVEEDAGNGQAEDHSEDWPALWDAGRPSDPSAEQDHQRIEQKIGHLVFSAVLEAPTGRTRHILERPPGMLIALFLPAPHPEEQDRDGNARDDEKKPETG